MSRHKLYNGQPGVSSAAVYTSTNLKTTLTAATVTNPTGGAVTLDAWLVASGGSANDASKIYDALSVGAGDQVGLPLLVAQTLDEGEAIHMLASSATSLTVHISGDKHS